MYGRRTRTEKHPFRNIDWEQTPVVRAMAAKLLTELYQRSDDVKPIGTVKVYCVKQRRGRAKMWQNAISVPDWVIRRGALQDAGYLEWYTAHELAHLFALREDRNSEHGPVFMRWLKRICPPEAVHYELGYKPRNAAAAGISKPLDKPAEPCTMATVDQPSDPNTSRRTVVDTAVPTRDTIPKPPIPAHSSNAATRTVALHKTNSTARITKMNDQAFDFQIDTGIEIPKRDIQGRPRGSQYPLEQMTQGQSFFLPITGVDGATRKDKAGNVFELNAEEDAARQIRQKQSYFSQLGKTLGISITTRNYEDGAEYSEKYAGQAGIGVWHNGERTEKDAENEVELDAADAGYTGDEE